MKDEQRLFMEKLADPTQRILGSKWVDAAGAVLAEIDWLKAETEQLKADAIDTEILCRRSDAFRREIEQLKAELAAAKAEIDHLAMAIEPSRPAAIVRLSGGKWHPFEDEAEARRFVVEKVNQGYAVDAFNVSEWNWHSRGK